MTALLYLGWGLTLFITVPIIILLYLLIKEIQRR